MAKRILILAMSFPPQAVGTGAYAYALGRGLTQRGYEVLVLAPAGDGDAAFDARAEVAVERLNVSSFVPLRYLQARARLQQQIDRFAPDCVWAANGMATRVAGLLNCWERIPLIASMRGSDVTVRLSARGIGAQIEGIPQRRAYRRAAAIAAVSRFVRARAVAQGVDEGVIFVHPPAFDGALLQRYRFDEGGFWERYPELKEKRIVLSVARLVAQKRVDRALRASGRLLKEFPDMVHAVVGDGPERAALERMAGELGWGDRVVFVGKLAPLSSDLFDFYSAAAVFLLPSVREGMGNVFIEAGAFALPCLAAADGGVPECIDDGASGLLARPDDVEDLSAKLRFLLKDPQRAREMGAAAREKVGREYGIEALVQRGAEALEQVMHRG